MADGIRGGVTFAISGAVLGSLLTFAGQLISARHGRTEILPSPLETVVAMKKDFVTKDDFNEFLRQYRDDIRGIEKRVTEDLREASAIRQAISGQIGEIRGEIRQMSANLAAMRDEARR